MIRSLIGYFMQYAEIDMKPAACAFLQYLGRG